VRKKGSKSPVKAKDIWSEQDDAVLLKYCKEDPRLRFYHALAMDTSGRPGELLQIKIGDIDIKRAPESGEWYTRLDIGRYGKKKESRIVPMINSIKYYREYLPSHPQAGNPNAFVFISKEYSSKYRNQPISVGALRAIMLALERSAYLNF
jgi:integrase